jgi:hypothetical protein
MAERKRGGQGKSAFLHPGSLGFKVRERKIHFFRKMDPPRPLSGEERPRT